MRRRTVCSAAIVSLAAMRQAYAQPAARKFRLGYLGSSPDSDTLRVTVEPWRQGLRELGWIEGQNLAPIEFRWAEGKQERQQEEQRRMAIAAANHTFGPAGLLEQDDGENWSHSTRGAQGAVTRRRPLNYAMGRGHDRVQIDPSGQSRIETVVNEHGQRWTYLSWQEWMLADSWQALMANHSEPPTGVV